MNSIELIQGNCIDEMQKLIDNGVEVDMILTDPPYNISQKNFKVDRSKAKAPIMRRKKAINYDFGEWDNMERQEFLDFTRAWYELCVEILKEGGGIYLIFQ